MSTSPHDENAPTSLHIPELAVQAVGVNLYVLFTPAGTMTSTTDNVSKSSAQVKRLLKGIFSVFVPGNRASTTATLPEPPAASKGAFLKTSSEQFLSGTRRVEGWIFHQIALPATIEDERVLLPEVALHDLSPILHQMLAFACSRSNRRIGYLIIHINQLRKSGNVRSDSKEEPSAGNGITEPLEVSLRTIFDSFDPLQYGVPRGYFEHYNTQIKQRGYIIIGQHAALLADLPDTSFKIFANLLQSGALDSQGGFTSEGLAAVLTRIVQWDSNEDLRESVDRLFDLKVSTDAATHGQIWISYALALIGVVLALISTISYPAWLTPGLLLLGLSCLAHARYAQKGTSRWSVIGKVVFWVGVAAIVAGFILGVLVPLSLPQLNAHH
ncbi:MAG: hypothetical protein NVSMB27_12940 [Ktedonobacteraceae bacterium]